MYEKHCISFYALNITQQLFLPIMEIITTSLSKPCYCIMVKPEINYAGLIFGKLDWLVATAMWSIWKDLYVMFISKIDITCMFGTREPCIANNTNIYMNLYRNEQTNKFINTAITHILANILKCNQVWAHFFFNLKLWNIPSTVSESMRV